MATHRVGCVLHPGQGACQEIAPNNPEPWCGPCCPSRRSRIKIERSKNWVFVYSINLLPQEWNKLSRFPVLLAGPNFGNDQAITSLLKLSDLVCRGFASTCLSCCWAGAAVGWLPPAPVPGWVWGVGSSTIPAVTEALRVAIDCGRALPCLFCHRIAAAGLVFHFYCMGLFVA